MVAAKSWQAHAREAAKAGVAEPERKALAKVGVPVLLSVDAAKPYLPVGVGSTIWHERASNIIRVGYLAAGRRVTKSISIDAVGLEGYHILLATSMGYSWRGYWASMPMEFQ